MVWKRLNQSRLWAQRKTCLSTVFLLFPGWGALPIVETWKVEESQLDRVCLMSCKETGVGEQVWVTPWCGAGEIPNSRGRCRPPTSREACEEEVACNTFGTSLPLSSLPFLSLPLPREVQSLRRSVSVLFQGWLQFLHLIFLGIISFTS